MRKYLLWNRVLAGQIVFIVVLVALFFGNALFTNKLYFFYDTIMQNFPFGQFFADGFGQFKLHLWCPHIFSGFPLFAEGQAGPLYPLFGPLLLLAPYWVVYKFSIALHSLLAGIFMLLFLRQRKLSAPSSLLGAVAFAFSGFFVAQVSHINIIRGYCYLPAILAAIEAVRARGMRRWWLIPVLSGTFLLGTHPYVAIYVLLAVGLWLTFGLLERKHSPRKTSAARWLAIAGGLALGLGLAACQVLPSAELLEHSTRGQNVSLGFLTAGSLPARNLITLLLPNFFGTPATNCYWGPGEIGLYAEFCGYVGLLTLILAAIAILFGRGRKLLYFVILLAGSILFALGNQTPFYLIFAKIPVINATRTPARFMFLAVFALSALSAYGLEHLLSLNGKPRTRRLVSIYLVLIVAALSITAYHFALGNSLAISQERSFPAHSRNLISDASRAFFARYGESLSRDMWRFGIISGLSALLLVLIVSRPRQARYLAFGLSVLLFVDLFSFGHGFNPVVPTKVYTRPGKLVRLLRAEPGTFRTLRWHVRELWRPRPGVGRGERQADPFTPGWANNLDKYRNCTESLVPNTNMLYGIDSADGYTSFGLARYNELLGAPGKCAWPRFEPSPGLLSLLNVKFVISSEVIDSARLAPVFTDGDLYLYQNADFLPRFFLVDKAIVLRDEADVLKAVRSRDFHPLSGVLLAASELQKAGSFNLGSMLRQWPIEGVLGAPRRAARPSGSPGKVSVIQNDPGDITLEVQANRPAFLVVSENDYPGWEASVNGEPSPILRADGLVKAIAVPKGKSVVKLVFEPKSFGIGLIISLLSAMVLSCAAIAFRGCKPVEPSPETEGGGKGLVSRWVVILVAVGLIVGPGFLGLGGNQRAADRLHFASVVSKVYCDSAAKALRQGENEAAAEAAKAALELTPDNVRAHYLLGAALFGLEDWGGARRQWERCLELEPKFSPALRGLGKLGMRFER